MLLKWKSHQYENATKIKSHLTGNVSEMEILKNEMSQKWKFYQNGNAIEIEM